jgi:hypothetical protein
MGTYDIRIRGNGPYSGFGNEYDANRLGQDLVKRLKDNGHDVVEARFVADGGGEDNLLTADYTRFAGPAPSTTAKPKPPTPLEEATKLTDEQREDEERIRRAGPLPRVPVAPQDATAGQGMPSAAGQTAGTVQPAGGGATTEPGQRTASGPTQPVPQPANKSRPEDVTAPERPAPGPQSPVRPGAGPALQGPAATRSATATPGSVREPNTTSDEPPANRA